MKVLSLVVLLLSLLVSSANVYAVSCSQATANYKTFFEFNDLVRFKGEDKNFEHEMHVLGVKNLVARTPAHQELQDILSPEHTMTPTVKLENSLNQWAEKHKVDLSFLVGMKQIDSLGKDYVAKRIVPAEGQAINDPVTGFIRVDFWLNVFSKGIFMITDAHDTYSHMGQFLYPKLVTELRFYRGYELNVYNKMLKNGEVGNNTEVNLAKDFLFSIQKRFRESTFENMSYLTHTANRGHRLVVHGGEAYNFAKATSLYFKNPKNLKAKERLQKALENQAMTLVPEILDYLALRTSELAQSNSILQKQLGKLAESAAKLGAANSEQINENVQRLMKIFESVGNSTPRTSYENKMVAVAKSIAKDPSLRKLFNLNLREQLFEDGVYAYFYLATAMELM